MKTRNTPALFVVTAASSSDRVAGLAGQLGLLVSDREAALPSVDSAVVETGDRFAVNRWRAVANRSGLDLVVVSVGGHNRVIADVSAFPRMPNAATLVFEAVGHFTSTRPATVTNPASAPAEPAPIPETITAAAAPAVQIPTVVEAIQEPLGPLPMVADLSDWQARWDGKCCSYCPLCGAYRASAGISAVAAHLITEAGHQLPAAKVHAALDVHRQAHTSRGHTGLPYRN